MTSPENSNLKKQFSKSSKLMLAIDYGTSNSLVAVTDGSQHSKPLPIDPIAKDPTVLRSLLYFRNQDTCFYGQAAVDEYCEDHADGRLIRSIKKYLPVESFKGTWIENRVVRLEDLIGYFLLEMKKRASACIDQEVDSLLLGRPAKFSADPVQDKMAEYRLLKAAEFAGFKHISFLQEPLAAAFDLRQRLNKEKIVLVVDLGGGTSDFTLIRMGPENYNEKDLLGMGGLSVAGDVIDGEFMKHKLSPFFGSKVKYRVPLTCDILEMPKSLLDHICSPADIALLSRNQFMQFYKNMKNWAVTADDKVCLNRLFALAEDQLGFQLFEEIDKTKRQFSGADSAQFEMSYPDIDLKIDVAKPEYNQIIFEPTEKILTTMDEVITEAGLTPQKIDIVYCTGGTSKLSLIQQGLLTRFGADKMMTHSNFFHSVIEGLVARAQQII